MEFNTFKLNEIFDSISIKHSFNKEELVFLNTSDILNGSVLNNNYTNVDSLPGQAKKSIQYNDILYSEIRPRNKRYALIDFDATDYVVSTKLMVLRLKKNMVNKVDLLFIYQVITSNKFIKELQAIAEGRSGTFPQITFKEFGSIEINIPEIKHQRKISQIVSIIHQKETVNKEVISNLEELAKCLFQHWFIDFEFPNEEGKPYKSSGGEMVESELGKLPKGWGIKSLDEIAKFQNGLAMQKFRPEENAGSLPVLKIKELNQGNTTLNSERCSLDIKNEVKVFDGDVIFSWSGTLLVKLWTGGAAGLNQHLFKVTSEKYEKWFYYLWTKHYLKVFQARAAEKATTMGHIKRSHLNDAKINLPPEEILTCATDLIQPIIEKIVVLGIENRNLAKLRDTLLPKLLSGEIEIPDELEV